MFTSKDFFPESQHEETPKTKMEYYKKNKVLPRENTFDILFGNSEYMKKGYWKEGC